MLDTDTLLLRIWSKGQREQDIAMDHFQIHAQNLCSTLSGFTLSTPYSSIVSSPVTGLYTRGTIMDVVKITENSNTTTSNCNKEVCKIWGLICHNSENSNPYSMPVWYTNKSKQCLCKYRQEKVRLARCSYSVLCSWTQMIYPADASHTNSIMVTPSKL